MNEDPIERALGLRPIADIPESDLAEARATLPAPIEELPTEFVAPSVESDETIRDIELARANIKNIIEKGDESLSEMIDLAKQSESPRAFEVASTLMKTLLDANKDFVEMSMKKKYAKDELINPKEAATTNVTNNNLILSTADLLAMIRGEKE
jgi:hypothetical protein